MNEYVTDTHPLIWHLTNDRRLSTQAKSKFADADAGLCLIWIPGIVLIEMVYLAEKGVIPKVLVEHLIGLLHTPGLSYQVAHLNQLTASTMLNHVPWSAVPELADRIVTATAYQLGISVISKDQKIQAAKLVPCVW